MKRIIIALTLASSIMPMKAQYGYSEKKDTVKLQPLKNVQYLLEAQASLSGNKTAVLPRATAHTSSIVRCSPSIVTAFILCSHIRISVQYIVFTAR